MRINFFRKLILKLKREQDIENLIKMGLKIGENFNKQARCTFDYSHCWLITVGDDVTFSSNVHILAHDASTKTDLNYTKIGLVSIGNKTFLGCNVTVLPNVSIGNNCIIGAGSVVTKNVPNNCVYAGNPAKFISTTEEYLKKQKILMNKRPVYDEKWTIRKNISFEQKQEMIKALQDGIAFVE